MNKKLAFVLVFLFIVACVCSSPETSTSVSEPTTTKKPVITKTATKKPTQKPAENQVVLTVKAGELKNYLNKITKDSVVNVYMLDGSLDPREDDLKQLCLDWHFYRNRILKYSAEGNTRKADQAREDFKMINYFLNDYNEDDVSSMLSLIEQKGW